MIRNFSISIYVIIPLVFGMSSILSFIVSFQVARYCQQSYSLFPFILSGSILFLLSVIAGYYIIWFLLKPSEQFIEKVKNSSILDVVNENNSEKSKHLNQVEDFTKIFRQVAQALDIIESEKLFPDIIGKSKPMRQVFSQIVKVASTDSTVLISGESGTGKELIAQSIVELGPRKDKPFIKINCAAISPDLMESELFGHERGSFTGAIARKKGCFELANGGSLFLDEIGDMQAEHQVKLLRVLQERSFFRVGGDAVVKVNVRIIAATNKNLATVIKEGKFREDLFYRINIFPISLPALRKRKEDIELLASYFLKKINPKKTFDFATLELLKNYNWPGNVRELENIIERAAVLSGSQDIVTTDNLPSIFQTPKTIATALATSTTLETSKPSKAPLILETGTTNNNNSLNITLQNIEKSIICESLTKNRGIQVKTAKELGITPRSLGNRIKKLKIDINTFKYD